MCKYPDDEPNERCKEGGGVEVVSRKIPSQVNNKIHIKYIQSIFISILTLA